MFFFSICKEFVDENTISGFKLDRWEIDILVPSYNLCLEYDGIYYHGLDKFEVEIRKNTHILSNNYNLIRIKETNDEEKIKIFKEKIDGVFFYYIGDRYTKEYFDRYSKIFNDIFNKNISAKILKEKYNEIKISTKLY